MTKRALVVDDSRSARTFLARILERHALEVDSAESAEDAIEYLKHHRPDVIFMDHLMPGMDGFQAVQAIKNNPATATIPILMYTSQEGELYLGQARALGAIGVLPKQIRPADVTQVLHQLHLVEERRGKDEPGWAEAGANDPTVQAHAIAEPPPPAAPAPVAAAANADDAPVDAAASTARLPQPVHAETLLRDQIAELRRALLARLDEQQEALAERVREIVRAELPPPPPLPPPPEPDRRGWGVAVLVGILALVFALLWWREAGLRTSLERALLDQATERVEPDSPVAAPASPAVEPAADAAGRTTTNAPVSPVVFPVPFGEQPLAGDRVAAVRGVLEALRHDNYSGDVDIQVTYGRFCMVGNPTDGFSLPPSDLPQPRCDRMGNPALVQDGGTGRESLPFANMLAEQRRLAGAATRIRIADSTRVVEPYPAGEATAGAWNAAAAANNRVELHWREAP